MFKSCHNCKNRAINCHSTCRDYLEEVERNNKAKELKAKDKEFKDFKIGVVLKANDRNYRKNR